MQPVVHDAEALLEATAAQTGEIQQVGGASGTGIAARNRGEEVTLPEGIAVEIRLESPFTR